MSMTLATLTGKKVRISIKRGWTTDDFCGKFGCSTDELFARIGQLYTVRETALQVWSEIAANEKKARKATKVAEAEIVEEVAQQVIAEETTDSVEEAEPETAEPVTENPALAELREIEEKQSATVVNLEKEHTALASERYNLRKSFQRVREELMEIRAAFEAKGHEAEEIVQKDNELVNRMNEIAVVYREERASLETIRDRIKEAFKIAIGVYSNGEITLLEESEIVLDETGHEELFETLREREEAEDFRPRDLRVVARLMTIVSRLTVPFDITFDNDEVQLGYELFGKEVK